MIANWDTISKYVAPLAGAWIEIMLVKVFHALLMVAPLAGAWIEISLTLLRNSDNFVAPLAGAWIEIGNRSKRLTANQSLPSRERGLK